VTDTPTTYHKPKAANLTSPLTSKSLLLGARDPRDVGSWQRLSDIYTPLIRRWARPYVAQSADGDDVLQDVLTMVVREIPRFDHNGRPGAFRAWLRAIVVNRLRNYWESRRAPHGTGDSTVLEQLNELEDPDSPLVRAWDEEHDRHVVGVLLESIRLEFLPATWHAFEAIVRQGRAAADVAAELGLTVNAVLIAKSRVLKRLREKAAGLVDFF
jgi:RNA polymerase sigma-70 factor, ECF subfamily